MAEILHQIIICPCLFPFFKEWSKVSSERDIAGLCGFAGRFLVNKIGSNHWPININRFTSFEITGISTACLATHEFHWISLWFHFSNPQQFPSCQGGAIVPCSCCQWLPCDKLQWRAGSHPPAATWLLASNVPSPIAAASLFDQVHRGHLLGYSQRWTILKESVKSGWTWH